MADVEFHNVSLNVPEDGLCPYVGFAITSEAVPKILVILAGVADDGARVPRALCILTRQEAEATLASFRKIVAEAKNAR